MDLVTSVPRMSKEEFESILNSNMQVYNTLKLILARLPFLVKDKNKLTKPTSACPYMQHICAAELRAFSCQSDPILKC